MFTQTPNEKQASRKRWAERQLYLLQMDFFQFLSEIDESEFRLRAGSAERQAEEYKRWMQKNNPNGRLSERESDRQEKFAV